MSKTDWTPGPWNTDDTATVRNSEGWIVAEVLGAGQGDMHPNARLIAAAPELYAALDGLITAVVRKGSNDPEETGEDTSADLYLAVIAAIDTARGALAKARGESQI